MRCGIADDRIASAEAIPSTLQSEQKEYLNRFVSKRFGK
jgi:hypothetical protein